MLVRERYSIRNPDEITGYAVALPTHGAGALGREQSVWFGGGKLAPDLTFPQLQARWAAPGTADPKPDSGTAGRAHPGRQPGGERQPGLELTELERQQLWRAAQHAVQYADAQIRYANNPRLGAPIGAAATAAYADAQAAASAASEVLSAISWLLERKRGGPLRTAADSYDRAARDFRRRTMPVTPHSRKVRTAARGLLSTVLVTAPETRPSWRLARRVDRGEWCCSLRPSPAESKRLERLMAKPAIETRSQVITLTRPAPSNLTTDRRQPAWCEPRPSSSSSEMLNTAVSG